METNNTKFVGNLFTQEGVYLRPVTIEEVYKHGYLKVYYTFLSNLQTPGVKREHGDAIAFGLTVELLCKEFNKQPEETYVGFLQTN